MAAKPVNRPFPLLLEVELLDRLNEPVRDGRAKSVSELIRTALERYNFEQVIVVRPSQLAISVRLPAAIRQTLKQVSREKHTSVGQLVRAAVESYLLQIESGAVDQFEMPIPHVELPEPEAPAPPPAASAAKTSAPRPRRRATPRKRKKSARARLTKSKRTVARRKPAAAGLASKKRKKR